MTAFYIGAIRELPGLSSSPFSISPLSSSMSKSCDWKLHRSFLEFLTPLGSCSPSDSLATKSWPASLWSFKRRRSPSHAVFRTWWSVGIVSGRVATEKDVPRGLRMVVISHPVCLICSHPSRFPIFSHKVHGSRCGRVWGSQGRQAPNLYLSSSLSLSRAPGKTAQ